MEDNIIAIKHQSEERANLAFRDFMRTTECVLNQKVGLNPDRFKGIPSKEIPKCIEEYSLRTMKEIAPSTPFRPDEIVLVSGHTFPDIIAERYYGIEVKSTTQNHWTTTGSSILESTRNAHVENIYMLFAKLGGFPEFRCKPYQDCLSDIAVTHFPRYLINMELPPSETIFSKMGITYDELRNSPDQIEKVRNYYRHLAKNKEEMPWWLEGVSKMNIAFFNNLPRDKKRELQIKAYALFASDILSPSNFKDKYKNVSLWLCSYYSLLCNNMRDAFSAGGRCTSLKGITLKYSIPKTVGNMLALLPEIREELRNPGMELLDAIRDFWDFDYNSNLLYESWLKRAAEAIHEFYPYIEIEELIEQFS